MSMWSEGMWFGTRDYARWIPCPKVDADMSKVGWSARSDFLNGGASVVRSKAAHKEYTLAWPLQARDNLRPVTDFADGIYGNGPFYFIDPFAADKNILPQYWAAPMQGAYDAPLLAGTALPTLATTVSNTNGYPVKSAVYTLAGTTNRELYVPIPTGYTLWLGAHGTATGTAVVSVKPVVSGTTYATPVSLTLLATTSTTRMNASFSAASYSGVLISLAGTGTITLAGLMGQLVEGVGSSTSTVTRTNFITNPNIETDLTGWGSYGGIYIRDTTTKYAGLASIACITQDTGDALAYSKSPATSGLISGQTYSLSFYVKGSVGVTFSATLTLGSGTKTTNFTGTGAWQLVKVENRTCVGTASIYIEILTNGVSDFNVDNVLLQQGATVGTYFDGSTIAGGGYTYAWTGTTNNSRSTETLTTTVAPPVADGGFISGQGNSGCEFESQPQLQNYSSAMDKVGLAVKMIEVGAWL